MRQSNEAWYQALSVRERALFDCIMVIADSLFKDSARYSMILSVAREMVERAETREQFDMVDATKH